MNYFQKRERNLYFLMKNKHDTRAATLDCTDVSPSTDTLDGGALTWRRSVAMSMANMLWAVLSAWFQL